MLSRVGACLLVLASGPAGLVSAQTSVTTSPKFAAEIVVSNGIPQHTPIANGVSTLLYDSSLHRKPSAEAGGRVASALKIEYHVDGDVVQITATVFYGDFGRLTTPVSLYNLRQEKVDTVSARLNQTVTLSGMAAAGLEPLAIKIVPAQPEFPTGPQVLSKAPSLRVELAGEDRTFYKLKVHNVSAKAVSSIMLEMRHGRDSQSSTSDSYPKVLIAPDATYQTQFSIPYNDNSAPALTLELECAIFQDGTWEGDVVSVAGMAATQVAREVQRQRIDRAINVIVAGNEGDDDAKVAQIRAAVAKFGDQPDGETIERLRARFAGLPAQLPASVMFALKVGLNNQKQATEFELKEFARRKATIPGYTLARWRSDPR